MIHENITYDEYAALPGLRASDAVHGIKSALALQYALALDNQARTESSAMRIGSIVHSLVELSGLTPWRFMPDYNLDCDNCTKDGKPSTSSATEYVRGKVVEWHKNNEGCKTVCTKQEMATACRMYESIKRHPIACGLVTLPSRKELSVTGKLCDIHAKGRIDVLFGETLIDIKTTASVDPRVFTRQFINLRMAFRLQWYRLLLLDHEMLTRAVEIIAVENQPPYDVAVFSIPLSVLNAENDNICTVCERYRHGMDTEEWPGLGTERRIELPLPCWALPELEGFDDENEIAAAGSV